MDSFTGTESARIEGPIAKELGDRLAAATAGCERPWDNEHRFPTPLEYFGFRKNILLCIVLPPHPSAPWYFHLSRFDSHNARTYRSLGHLPQEAMIKAFVLGAASIAGIFTGTSWLLRVDRHFLKGILGAVLFLQRCF